MARFVLKPIEVDAWHVGDLITSQVNSSLAADSPDLMRSRNRLSFAPDHIVVLRDVGPDTRAIAGDVLVRHGDGDLFVLPRSAFEEMADDWQRCD